MKGIQKRFASQLTFLESRGIASKLWVQYFRMVALVKQVTHAERTGNTLVAQLW